ncbi:MAG: MFS transporter [Dehalococcoidia bacterium]
MKSSDCSQNFPGARPPLFYGWVIVIVCFLQQALQNGIQYSFGIFFKPLVADFGWTRASLSGVYALSMICGGLFAIPAGWLADRFGPAKIALICGTLIGLGLILSSRITDLVQLYIAYGFIFGIGTGGVFAISSGITARWFYKKRGLALGIVSAGVGFGILIMPPLTEYFIRAVGWSSSYLIVGITALIIFSATALFLRRDPKDIGCLPYGAVKSEPVDTGSQGQKSYHPAFDGGMTLGNACRTLPLWLLVGTAVLVGVCTQMIFLHLVNYATDIGISPLTAATVMSVIGIGGIFGRILVGSGSDRIGNMNAMILCMAIQTASLVWLIFSGELWMLYVFAALFSFAFGGEIPLLTLLVSERFGLRAVSALVGLMLLASRVGAAVGSWLGGQIFDVTDSYTIAFIIASAASTTAMIAVIAMKKMKKSLLTV